MSRLLFPALFLRINTVVLIDATATTIMIAKMIKFSSKDVGFGVDVTCGESEENGDWLGFGIGVGLEGRMGVGVGVEVDCVGFGDMDEDGFGEKDSGITLALRR